MKMEGNILQSKTSVVADAEVLDIQDGVVGFMVSVWVHGSPSPLSQKGRGEQAILGLQQSGLHCISSYRYTSRRVRHREATPDADWLQRPHRVHPRSVLRGPG